LVGGKRVVFGQFDRGVKEYSKAKFAV
jgi:hypothetical protein